MADTGSFPIGLQVPPTSTRSPWASGQHHDAARTFVIAIFGMFLLGAGCAAAGLQLESQGYGSLILLGGALIGVATAVPAWLLFRPPGRTPRR